ncbi:tyrosine-type recombinase/integrase [uncultured Bifidobacterium sp.]|uniref:tyrosine-type recombinase/integrase n=1 Tax=uncultured Bifidobacterium sp. TaxID=165187 RepID=UPI002595B586|nr:tyrosine-type recombinase/integrase [uncultured Bifidobacterium sp.]
MTNNKRMAMPDSWAAAAHEFLEYKRAAGLADTSLLTLRRRLRAFAAEICTPPELVTQRQLVQYLAGRKAIETKRACRNLFTAFFAWFETAGYRADNPARLLPAVRRATPRPKPCTDDMISAALERATAEERLMVLLAATCGLRRGEICRVQSADVITGTHGEHSLIVHGKGGKQRIVPLTEELAQAITAAGGYLFPGRWGGHVEESYVGKRVSRLLPPGYSCHKLRHRFATVAYTDSHDMLAVARALGHSSTDTTQAYVALPEEALRALTEAAALPHDVRGDVPHSGAKQAGYDQGEDMQADGTASTGRRLAGDDTDVLLASLLLAWSMIDGIRAGSRSFRIDAVSLAEQWGLGNGRGRRSQIVQTAARRLDSLGVIDLASGSDGYVCGNCTASLELLEMVKESYWREWQARLVNEDSVQ